MWWYALTRSLVFGYAVEVDAQPGRGGCDRAHPLVWLVKPQYGLVWVCMGLVMVLTCGGKHGGIMVW